MKRVGTICLILTVSVLAIVIGIGSASAKSQTKIVHDAEYYILAAQNGEKWAAEDMDPDLGR